MRLDSCTRGIWRSLIVKIGRPSVRWQGLATLILATFPLVGRADNAPTNWQIGLPKPQSPIAESIYGLHYNLLMPIIIVITVFVLGLMLYTCWRFAEKRNPIPSKTTHNHTIEILWTVIPVLILVVIAVPSFRLLYDYHTIPESEITLKVTGHQWYWSYEYVEDNLEFDANLIPEEELNDAQLRLMTTDNPVYLPVGKNIRIQTIASDVLHSWSVPSLGVKMDSVPGRLNEVWTHINEPGTYYGFCSELCGVRHAYMPIMIVAVPENEYNRWLSRAKSEFAKTGTIPKLQDDETAAQLASTR